MLTLEILEILCLIYRFSMGPLIENVVLLSYLCLSEMQLPCQTWDQMHKRHSSPPVA